MPNSHSTLRDEIAAEIEELSSLKVFETKSQAIYQQQLKVLSMLTRHHFENSLAYNRIISALGTNLVQLETLEDLPFIPVSLFKKLELKSVEDNQVVKSMSSSGTTGQKVSRIYLDKQTSQLQTKTLTKIVGTIFGQKRLPMIILDTPHILKNSNDFSARGAGILGFSMFASDKVFAFSENFELNIESLREFLKKHSNERIVYFGFTYMVWQHFMEEIKDLEVPYPKHAGILLHGGGWKKLASLEIGSNEFSETFKSLTGVTATYDYYGMVEQTGSIYLACANGFFHTSQFSTVIIRSTVDFSPCDWGDEGIIQTISVLPLSYPGHSLLTEDLGIAFGIDDCKCGWSGIYFTVIGRIPNVEVRGCSDTFSV